VACDHRVTVNNGATRMHADEITAGLPDAAWQRYSAGVGSKGPRWYDWAWVEAAADTQPNQTLLIRRHTITGELAFYRCWTPTAVTLATLVRVAGIRWCVEESFQAGEGQARPGPVAGQRLDTLAPVHHPGHARAGLPVGTGRQYNPPHSPDPHRPARDNGPIALTTPEIRRLFRALLGAPVEHLAHLLRWSLWRRRHQSSARQAHYRRRLAAESNP
jgi:hypothetical protein